MGLIIAGAVVLVVVLLVVGIYNRLVALRQTVRQGLADIDAQLRQRSDLIPNLVNTVKGYAAHEQETFDAVIAARNKASSPNAGAGAEAELGGALGKLVALGEAYPDLKASANFQALQGELSDVEDKLAASRRALNGAAARYNAARESFPAVLLAGPFGFQAADFHSISAEEKGRVDAVPDVRF